MHRARFVRQLREDRLDHRRIFDARDDAHRTAAARTGSLDIDTEHALQALCPAHRSVAAVAAATSRRSGNIMVFSTLFEFLPAWYVPLPLGNDRLWRAFLLFMYARGIGMYIGYRKKTVGGLTSHQVTQKAR